SAGLEKRMGVPPTRISPESGECTPDMILIRVDLPAPFSPRIAWIVPSRHEKSTSSSALTPEKNFETRVSSTCGGPEAALLSPLIIHPLMNGRLSKTDNRYGENGARTIARAPQKSGYGLAHIFFGLGHD